MSYRPRYVDLRDGWQVTPEMIAKSEEIIDRSGLVAPLDLLLHHGRGRPRKLATSRGPLVAMMINALRRHHLGHLIEVARLINGQSLATRLIIGLPVWDETTGYRWLDRWFVDLARTLAEAPEVELNGETVKLDLHVFMNAVIRGSVPPDGPQVDAIAVDGTAIETWGALYADPSSVDVPPDASSTRQPHMRSRRPSGAPKVQVHGHGTDGRPIYTKDPNARAGHRTATNSKRGGKFVGYELHLLVQVPGVSKTNYIDEVHFKDPVPNIVLGCSLQAAGSHRGDAVVPILTELCAQHPTLTELLVDGGYTRLKASRFWVPVRKLGLRVVFETMLEQRGQKPTTADALWIDGNFFSPHLPERLIGRASNGSPEPFPMPPWRSTNEAKLENERPFNERAKWRHSPHSRPTDDGYMRIRCPFCAGRLASRAFPRTMRAAASRPLVVVPGSPTQCCGGITTINASESLYWQEIPFGTTAWRKSYGRRQIVEGVNAAIKCQFVRTEGGYARVLGQDKLGILMAFTLAGYNAHRIESFTARTSAPATAPTRAKKRKVTYDQVGQDVPRSAG